MYHHNSHLRSLFELSEVTREQDAKKDQREHASLVMATMININLGRAMNVGTMCVQCVSLILGCSDSSRTAPTPNQTQLNGYVVGVATVG